MWTCPRIRIRVVGGGVTRRAGGIVVVGRGLGARSKSVRVTCCTTISSAATTVPSRRALSQC